MIYSSICENRKIIEKLKSLGFPQVGGVTESYIDTRYQNQVYNYDPKKEELEYLEYEPLYSEILDWIVDELGLNFFIRSRNKDSQITWEYEVWLIETGSLIRAGRDINNEIDALKQGISAAIEIKPEEIQEFIDQFYKDQKIKSGMIENA